MLALHNNEEILFFMKIGTNPFLKNDIKDARLLWVASRERMIFMDYYRLPILPQNIKNWREKDIIPYSEIISIIAHKNKFSLTPEPLISIHTESENTYQVVFYTENSCKTKYNDLKAIITDINPKTEFNCEI